MLHLLKPSLPSKKREGREVFLLLEEKMNFLWR